MAMTLEQRLTEQGVSAQDTIGIKPLLDNKTFRSLAEAEIALLQDALDKAAALAKATGNYDAEVMLFLTASRSISAIEKQFTEVSDEATQIRALLSTAMSKVHYNPVAPTPAAEEKTPPTAPIKGIPAVPAASVAKPVVAGSK